MKILDNLRPNYEKAQAAPTLKLFLLNLFDFLSSWNDNPQLQAMNQRIITEPKETQKIYDQKKEEALQYLNSTWSKYEQYCKEHNINTPNLSIFESTACFARKNQTQSTGDSIINSTHTLIGKLTALVKTNNAHIPFVSQFANVSSLINRTCYTNANVEIKDFKNLSELKYEAQIIIELKTNTINNYLTEKRTLEQSETTTIWHHWNLITWLYKVHKENVVKNVLCAKSIFESWKIVQLSNQINNILTSTDNRTHLYKCSLNDLKYSLQKIWLYTEETMTQKTNLPIDSKTPYYDQSEGILYIEEKKININGETAEGRFTGLFFPAGKPFVNAIDIEEIHQDVFQTSADTNEILTRGNKNQVYALRNRLNGKKIKPAIGYDLFLLKNRKINLNPLFFKINH